MRRRLIRQLTEIEKRVTGKYLDRLAATEAEAERLRELLNDLAITLAGREGEVTMTREALYEPEANRGT